MNFPLPLRYLLWPLSLVYGFAAWLRAAFYRWGWKKQKRLQGVVVSVGNLTTGGTGKTPVVIWFAEQFLAKGKRVAILSRGYRGADGTSDEIEMMKKRLQGPVRFGVGKDRYAEGRKLEENQPVDFFLLDDGFQHLPLARDVDVVLVDTSRPLRNEFVLPAGRLREPKSALSRADLVVFTRTDSQLGVKQAIQEFPDMPIFTATTKLTGFRRVTAETVDASYSEERPPMPVYAFCGIGNPEAFFKDLKRWNVAIAGRSTFRDHHRYSEEDVHRLERKALRAGAKALLTTEKDAQNLAGLRFASLALYYCEIAAEIADGEQFLAVIEKKCAERKASAR